MPDNNLLRQLPKVDLLTQAARQVLDNLREEIKEGRKNLPCNETLTGQVVEQYNQNLKPKLQRVINGTGIILHTNLGRAPLATEALNAIIETARDYSNLEYDVEEGKRSSRHAHVEDLLTQLTGAEGAMVVNNNAAAVMLALATIAHDQDVLVSRGELVEIGGSFRVPDVITQSGCRLIEVGTTNKTHLRDYERPAGAILRVHTSNFIITGFVAKPTLEELAALSQPLIEDLGSGSLIPFHHQPTVADSIKAGVDIVTFSGDKLLGGPQAGIIVGRKDLIEKMKKHPLARAMRIDKLCLAALEATLRLYQDPDTVIEKIPTLKMLHATPEYLQEKATQLQSQLGNKTTVITQESQAGGGAMPGENFTTAAVAFTQKNNPNSIEHHFRNWSIIGRIHKDRFILDVRTLNPEDFPYISICWESYVKSN
ncbi:MAG: L-seryl-tRNA(Sec) selenium transferase [Defluviitaleaceae bacterium]|nr:L-seryl-tRNA(Sec) selenium transferase [Defluviitaleaceae bacterium]